MIRKLTTMAVLLAMGLYGGAALSAGENVEAEVDVAEASAPLPAGLPFPVQVGGPFDLVDHHGDRRTDKDFHGQHLLVFFGYAHCPGICSAALPSMAAAVDELGGDADRVQPVLITVDPKWDKPAVMKEALAKYHPRLLGLTGSEDKLAEVRDHYQVEVEFVGEDIFGNPIYSHGSYVYLMGPDGSLKTVIPPILSPEQMADIIRNYLSANS